MDILRYVILTGQGDEADEGVEYDSYEQCKADARREHGAVVARTYTYDDSELIDDFRDDEDNT